MKKYINFKKSAALLALVVLVMGAGSASAQTPPAQPAPGSNFAQRLEQRKRERAIQLGERDLKRVGQQCVGAQTIVRGLQQKTGPIVANRIKTYQKIDAKLWMVIGQLKLAEKDTFELEKQRGQLAEKAADFQVQAANYQQVLDDIVVINCQADPVGLKTLVDTARLYTTQIRDRSATIRTQIVDGVKPILANQATSLQPKPATEEGN